MNKFSKILLERTIGGHTVKFIPKGKKKLIASATRMPGEGNIYSVKQAHYKKRHVSTCRFLFYSFQKLYTIVQQKADFPEMEGDIIYVDYELSSWKYMSFESSTSKDDLECYKIGGNKSAQYDIIAPYQIGKGGGSVYGGEWNLPSQKTTVWLASPEISM